MSTNKPIIGLVVLEEIFSIQTYSYIKAVASRQGIYCGKVYVFLMLNYLSYDTCFGYLAGLKLLFLTDSPICQSCLIPSAYRLSSVKNIYRVSVLLDELQIIDDEFLNCLRLPDNSLSSNTCKYKSSGKNCGIVIGLLRWLNQG